MTGSLSREQIRAAAETYRDLGPAYRDAVIDSFLDRVGREIDARLASIQADQPPARSKRRLAGSPRSLAIWSLILGTPISAIAVGAGERPAGVLGLTVVWIAISAINIAYAVGDTTRSRQSQSRRR
ncbi:hypothetical protein [Rhizohabitans arisaemae]|uniref:hypothetical protein n=1 Tax=Rhizohabitans arisaemae TaxID=2720610 RepID=UPI0024B0DEC7|nr:hypothetical protein [Rhizohabitans arisaemae]